jgi:opacity protein-like surface antigen
MLNLFRKQNLVILGALLLSSVSSHLSACCEPTNNRLYVGGFGGGIYSNSTKVSQLGVVFFTEAEGGPLAIDAKGRTKKTSSGFGGAQIGYEWSKYDNCAGWSLAPALEVEGFWFSNTKKGNLTNTINSDRLAEHQFSDTFKMNTGVYLANAVISLKNQWGLSPYVGVGAGLARLSINRASSFQVSPEEPEINHFSNRKDSSWTLAAQIKAGLRYTIFKSFHIFGEYRFLYLDLSDYVFGSTSNPSHAQTSPWNVKMKNTEYNSFVFGLQYDLY